MKTMGQNKNFTCAYLITSLFLFVITIQYAGQVQARGADALFINEKGDVGIGTDDPKATLDVNGTVRSHKFEGDGSGLKVDGDTLTLIKQALAEMVPIGTIMAYGGDVKNADIVRQLRSRGWLVCDGSLAAREKYKELFDAIKVSFGAGDGKTTFHLPDMRGRFVRGVDHGIGRDPDAKNRNSDKPGGNAGDKVGSVQEDQLKTHRHTVNAKHAGRTGGSSKGDPLAVAGWSENPATKQVEPSGGAETRPKNIYVNWIIKAKHVY